MLLQLSTNISVEQISIVQKFNFKTETGANKNKEKKKGGVSHVLGED